MPEVSCGFTSATGDPIWANKAEFALQWLIDHRLPGYSGACWGNHFDYQSRGFYLPKNVPTVVWTSLIGHAFLDAFDHFHQERYLEIAVSACEHIVHDLGTLRDGEGTCISYIPIKDTQVHNANTLGASLLARVYSHTGNESYREKARQAMQYTAQYQRPDASWYYAEKADSHWIDNFHTAYVLDCFKSYEQSTGDDRFDEKLMRGYEYWKKTFFLADGTPRYYHYKTLPLDIQCSSQAIDTLVFFHDRDPESSAVGRQGRAVDDHSHAGPYRLLLLSKIFLGNCQQDTHTPLGPGYDALCACWALRTIVNSEMFQ